MHIIKANQTNQVWTGNGQGNFFAVVILLLENLKRFSSQSALKMKLVQNEKQQTQVSTRKILIRYWGWKKITVIIKHWSRCQLLCIPTLTDTRGEKALRNLALLKLVQPWEDEARVISRGPFPPKSCYSFMSFVYDSPYLPHGVTGWAGCSITSTQITPGSSSPFHPALVTANRPAGTLAEQVKGRWRNSRQARQRG